MDALESLVGDGPGVGSWQATGGLFTVELLLSQP